MDAKRSISEKAASVVHQISGAGGQAFARGHDDYAHARAIWNGAVGHDPALVVPCRNMAEVQRALGSAQALGLPVSVRGGGHDWAGRALRQDGVVLDLSPMGRVTVDAGKRTATVSGTVTSAELSAAADRSALAAVTGNCGAVGVAGHLLGGGYGALTPRFGLAADNLVSAQVVLADGRSMTADAGQNQDLFWALRGGGGNFGVVTSLRLRLHPVSEVLGGLMLFPWSQAAAVFHSSAALAAAAPDTLAVTTGMVGAPDGTPAALVAPAWSGDAAEGQRTMARLRRVGTPILEQIAPMSFAELSRLYDAQVVKGRHYAIETRWLPDLSAAVVPALVAGGAAATSPFSAILLHSFHGAGTRVDPGATAFGLRRRHILVEVIAGWEPGDGTRHRAWARDLSEALAPHALPGGYANLLAPDAHDQIAEAFGPNAARLREVKRRYDPDNIFSAIPLPA